MQKIGLLTAVVFLASCARVEGPAADSEAADRAAIIDLLFALKRDRGATLVLVTHDLNLARLCDRMVRLRSGQVEAGAASAVA